MSEYKVVHDLETDRVEVFRNGELVGRCEAYELDMVCIFLAVTYEETGE